jgi:hypothetical protein
LTPDLNPGQIRVIVFWRRLRKGHDEHRVVEARARFWAEVHAGELEAEAQLRP